MYEAILSENDDYEWPDRFTSRTAEILQMYLKNLGVRMETVIDDDEFIGEPEHDEMTVAYELKNRTLICTVNELYYLKKLGKLYRKWLKERPNTIDDSDELMDYIMKNLPFKKKYLTDNILNMFKDNLEGF